MQNTTELDGMSTASQDIPLMKQHKQFNLQDAKLLLGFTVIFIPCIVIVNGFVLTVYIKFPKIRAQPHNVFIIALAITDFVTGLITIPMDIFSNISPEFVDHNVPIPWYYRSRELCLFSYFSIVQPLQWSSTTLVIIAMDRLLATCFPLKYYAIMTRARAVAAVVIGWIVSSIPLYTAIAIVDLKTHDPRKLCSQQLSPALEKTIVYAWSAIPVTISVISYIAIWIQLCRHPKQIENQRRQTVTMAVVIVAFIVCLLPMFVVLQRPSTLSEHGFKVFINIAASLVYLNSCINPIIYNVFNTSFRKCSRQLLGCGRSRASQAITTVSDNGVQQNTQVAEVTEM